MDVRIGDKRADFWEGGQASARGLRLLHITSAVFLLFFEESGWASENFIGNFEGLLLDAGCWLRVSGGSVVLGIPAVYCRIHP